MLLVLSILGFGLAIAIYIYLFDNFMGENDTLAITSTMAGMHEEDSVNNTGGEQRSSAAGSGS